MSIIYPIIYRASTGVDGGTTSTYPEPASYEVSFNDAESVTINHNTGKRCLVAVYDVADDNEEFEAITTHVNANTCVVEWNGARTGKAIVR
jgi:hypothetical protein